MKIQSLSVVVGTKACDAHCPFCISSMTGFSELPRGRYINVPYLKKAIMAAKMGQCDTLLITGKGEPTLYPQEITDVLKHAGEEFPFVELQTNGISIYNALAALAKRKLAPESFPKEDKRGEELLQHLKRWQEYGLTTIILSNVGFSHKSDWEEGNEIHQKFMDLGRSVYMPKSRSYIELHILVDALIQWGFTVRMSSLAMKGGVENIDDVFRLCAAAKSMGVHQLTIRPLVYPENTGNAKAQEYVEQHRATEFFPYNRTSEKTPIIVAMDHHATRLRTLADGAVVYDIEGQNVAISNCLTTSPNNEDIRSLIFYSNGLLKYTWQHEGSILLAGKPESKD